MNNKRATKRALLTSVMALVMCVVMLAGTTFAWFTDTASTGVNKIQAGNLDIELAYKNAKTMKESATDSKFETVTTDTKVFDESALWEPGHVEFVVLKISNAGTLALKYKLGINIANETGSTNVFDKPFKLSDYIEFAVIDGDKSNLGRDDLVAAATAAGNHVLNVGYTDEDHLVPAAKADNTATFSEKTVTLVVWMPKSVGNEANYKVAEGITAPSIDLGINVVATQYTYESDSFDEMYDKNAQYPEVSYAQVSSQDDLNNALKDPTDANGNPTTKVAVELKKDDTYTLPAMTGKDVTIIGTKDTEIDMTQSGIIGSQNTGLDLTIEGATVKFANDNYKGVTHSKKLTYKDCTITGQQFLYATEVEFINCTFEQNSSDAYNVWTYGAGNVLFKDCTFKCAGKSVLIYRESSSVGQTVEFQNCKFNASAPVAGKAAIEIDSSLLTNGAIYKVVIDQATANNVTGFDHGSVSNNSVWNNKKGNHATVIVAGNTVLTAS